MGSYPHPDRATAQLPYTYKGYHGGLVHSPDSTFVQLRFVLSETNAQTVQQLAMRANINVKYARVVLQKMVASGTATRVQGTDGLWRYLRVPSAPPADTTLVRVLTEHNFEMVKGSEGQVGVLRDVKS